MNIKFAQTMFHMLIISIFVLGAAWIPNAGVRAWTGPLFMLNVLNDSSWGGLDAWNWPLASQVTLTVDNPNTIQNPDYTEVQTMGPGSGSHTSHGKYMQDNNFEGHPGFTITLSDGIQTKTMIVPLLAITGYDLVHDTITGVSDPSKTVIVPVSNADGSGYAERFVVADSEGNWMADFAVSSNPDEAIFDLRPGDVSEPQIYDADHDHTVLRDWSVPPAIDARFHENEILGYGWPLDSAITMTIDDPTTPQPDDYEDTQTVVVSDLDPNQTLVSFRLWENNFELENGQIVIMSDGTTMKTHVVAIPTVTNIIDSQSLVEGLAEPSSEVWVDYSGDYSGATRHETVDATGHWLADFSVPGDEDFETETFPWMGSYSMGEVRYQDEDGDSTSINWGTGRMLLELDRDGNPRDIYLRLWPGRRPVTLTVDDPATPQNPDYTDIQIMYWSDGYSHLTIHWTGIFAVRPGFSITVTDGYIARTMIVPLLAITGYDLVHDTITGVSDPSKTVIVPVSNADGSGYAERFVVADSEGNWMADFAVSSNPDEAIFDLQPGDDVEPQMNDTDWNTTVLRDWSVPIDTDGDGIADVLDPCPDDATDTCNVAGSAAGVIGVDGGVLATENGKVTLSVPPESLGYDVTLSITDKGGAYELASDQGPMMVVHSYSIQPNGTQFDPPASITFRWDDSDNDDIVDGTTLQEAGLLLIKDGTIITPACSVNPDCDMNSNELTVQVDSLSLFELAVLPRLTLFFPLITSSTP